MQKKDLISTDSCTKVPHKLPYRLTNDYLFRALLQENTAALKYLISSLLYIPYSDICSADILNPIILGESIDDKTCILDLHIILNNNQIMNIEMQVLNCGDWPERSLYYLSRAYCNLKAGQSYTDILPTIHIGILNFSLFDDSHDLYSEYLMQNTKTKQIFSRKFAMRVLDLTQIDTTSALEEFPDLNYWAKFFLADTWEEVQMLSEKSEGIQEAVVTLKKLTEDEKIALQCEARERYDHDRASAIACGIRQGKEQGLELGLEQGRHETQLEIARKLLAKGTVISDIEDITGLSSSEIQSL